MTKALEEALKEARKLPEREQDQLAAAIRAEIEVERVWEAQLAASGGALAALADEALAGHRPVVPSRSTQTSSELQGARAECPSSVYLLEGAA